MDAVTDINTLFHGFSYSIGPYQIVMWWRRGELNPRPKTLRKWPLHA